MDKNLLEKYMCDLQGGNLNALDGVYELTSKSAYLLAYSILKSSEKAKDIMQDTFVRVVANIDKYHPNTNALAWISKIARNLSYREYAKGNRNVSLEALGDSLQDNVSKTELWADGILDMDLYNAIGKLDVEEREVVMLFSIEGYKHREIAKIVDKPLGTVLWIYSKALKKLKKIIEG